jgi:hypothetical protein
MDVQLGDSGSEGTADHPEAAQGRERLRRQAHDVDPHEFRPLR